MAAQYSDIYNYILGGNPTTGGGESGSSQSLPIDWQTGQPMEGFQYNVATNDSGNPYWSYNTPDKYKGIVNLKNTTDGPNGSAQWDNDYRALPGGGMTKYGPVEYTAPYVNSGSWVNPDMYYDDPLYGKITPQRNIKEDKDLVGSLIPKLAMAAGGAFIGGLAAPDLFGGKTLWNIGNQLGKAGLGFGGGGAGGINAPMNYGYNGGAGSLSNFGGGNTMASTRTSTPYEDYNGGDGSGGIGVGDWLGNIGNSLTNGIGVGDNLGLAGALSGPAFISAIQQYRNAGQYQDLGREAADRSDPFGSQRAGYAQRLYDTYNNPQAVLDDPQHRAVQEKQMNVINSKNRASGYLGSGKSNMDLADYQAQSDAQYLNQERDQLGNLAGAQFNPANAGAMLMEGGKLKINSENAALGTAMSPYLAYLAAQYGGNRVQSGGQMPGGGNIVRTGSGTGYNVNPGSAVGIGTGLWGSGRYPDPGDGSYGPQQDIYGPGSGWGQDVINPPDYGSIYGSGSGWGNDIIGGGGGGFNDYIPEGGGDIFGDWGSVWDSFGP